MKNRAVHGIGGNPKEIIPVARKIGRKCDPSVKPGSFDDHRARIPEDARWGMAFGPIGAELGKLGCVVGIQCKTDAPRRAFGREGCRETRGVAYDKGV